jgi:hypothetical protein
VACERNGESLLKEHFTWQEAGRRSRQVQEGRKEGEAIIVGQGVGSRIHSLVGYIRPFIQSVYLSSLGVVSKWSGWAGRKKGRKKERQTDRQSDRKKAGLVWLFARPGAAEVSKPVSVVHVFEVSALMVMMMMMSTTP